MAGTGEEQLTGTEQWIDREPLKQKKVHVEKEHFHGHPALGWVVNKILKLPYLLQLPIYALVFVFYSPPVTVNTRACVKSIRDNARLRIVHGPEFMFVWPLISMGFLFCLLAEAGWVPGAVLSWLYICLLVYTLVTIGMDFKAAGWFGTVIAVIALLAVVGWVATVMEIPVVAYLGTLVTLFGIESFPTSVVMAVSSVLLLLYVFVFVHMNLYDVLIIDGNYIQKKNFLGRSPHDTRTSFSIEPGTDDVNEYWLGFSIPIRLKSKTSRVSSHNLENVPAGPIVEAVITHLLNALEIRATDSEWELEDEGDHEEEY